jgi:hypothetical protein
VGAALLHDLALVPLYALGDRAVQAALRSGRPRPLPRTAVNHVRVPAFVSLLLLLVYWPLVLRHASPYPSATALSIDVYLGRWLLITAVLFAASAAWLVWRLWRERARDGERGRRRAR